MVAYQYQPVLGCGMRDSKTRGLEDDVDLGTCGLGDVWTRRSVESGTCGTLRLVDSGMCGLGNDVYFRTCGLGGVWTKGKVGPGDLWSRSYVHEGTMCTLGSVYWTWTWRQNGLWEEWDRGCVNLVVPRKSLSAVADGSQRP